MVHTHATLTLTSRRVLLPAGLQPASVVLRGDRVNAILTEPPAGVAVHDLGDAVLMPALTDTHVHIDEPGRTAWEGFASATRAAAAGGATLLVDMPLNSLPVTTTVEALQRKVEVARGQLWVDCAFWGGVVPGNTPELAPMVQAGAQGFKCFLCPSGIDEFGHVGADDLRAAMPALRDAGVPLLVHAELEDGLAQVPLDTDPRAYAAWLHARPKEMEDRAVALIAGLVAETGCRAHIVHLSSSTALDIVRDAKRRGLPVTAETCPHYLGLAAEEVGLGATEYKCAPPIRERANQDALWAALRDGTLDMVVTDHSPCVPSLKRFDTGNFLDAWGGVASLQLGLRSVWTEAARRGVDLATVSRWMSTNPAAFLGRADRGVLRPGAVADLIAFDPDPVRVLDPATLLHRHPTTPWAGRRLRGDVTHTWLRGELVAEHGRVDGPPTGRVVLGAPA